MPKIPFKKFMQRLNAKAAFPAKKDVLRRQKSLFPETDPPADLKAFNPRLKSRKYLKMDRETGEFELRDRPIYEDEPRLIHLLADDGHRIGDWAYTPMTWQTKERAISWVGRYYHDNAVLYDRLEGEIKKMRSQFIHLYYINGFHLDENYRAQNVATLAFAKALKAMRMKKPAIVFFEVNPADNRPPLKYRGDIATPTDVLARYYQSLGFDIVKDAYQNISGYKVFTK